MEDNNDDDADDDDKWNYLRTLMRIGVEELHLHPIIGDAKVIGAFDRLMHSIIVNNGIGRRRRLVEEERYCV